MTTLAECAAWHELQEAKHTTAALRAFYQWRRDDARIHDEHSEMHRQFALACREADGDEPMDAHGS